MKKFIMGWLFRKTFKLVPYYKYIEILITILTILRKLIMGENRGILSKADEKWLARFMDAAIELKGFAEMIDGTAIRILISTLDNIVAEKYVPSNWKNPLKELIVLGKTRDKDGIALFLDSKIDLPFLDDMYEKLAFVSVVNFLAVKMYQYIDSVDVAEDLD